MMRQNLDVTVQVGAGPHLTSKFVDAKLNLTQKGRTTEAATNERSVSNEFVWSSASLRARESTEKGIALSERGSRHAQPTD